MCEVLEFKIRCRGEGEDLSWVQSTLRFLGSCRGRLLLNLMEPCSKRATDM